MNKKDSDKTMRLIISEFPSVVTKVDLETKLSAYGTIQDLNFEDGRNIAYVTMSYDEQAKRAILELDRTKMYGHEISVKECE